jgi:chromosome segregation ATPase
MNSKRRKAIEKIIERFDELKSTLSEAIEPILNDIGDAKSDLTHLRDEEQEAYDALSDSAQLSERGEKINEALSSLNEADDKLEESLEHAKETVTDIETAIEEMRASIGDQ